VVRTDSAAATHQFTHELREARISFVMGYDLTESVRRAILGLPESAWRAAIRQDGEEREGARVAEITDRLNLSAGPDGTRVIVRRERPHPGAQLSFCDHDGHRFLATLTDLDGDAVDLERMHRARANTEDRVRAAKQTGLDNLPFRDFDHNAVWLELALIAQDLIAWTQLLALDGELAVWSPGRCATGYCTPSDARPSTPAAPPCACRPPGPGPARRPPRSPDSPRCQHRPRHDPRRRRPGADAARALTPPAPASARPQNDSRQPPPRLGTPSTAREPPAAAHANRRRRGRQARHSPKPSPQHPPLTPHELRARSG
jgi:Transposase DDE domain group 1